MLERPLFESGRMSGSGFRIQGDFLTGRIGIFLRSGHSSQVLGVVLKRGIEILGDVTIKLHVQISLLQAALRWLGVATIVFCDAAGVKRHKSGATWSP